MWKARVYWALRKYDLAVRTIDAAIRNCQKERAELFSKRGLMYESMGKIRLARASFDTMLSIYNRALAQDPENLRWRGTRNWYLTVAGHKAVAIREMDSLLRVHPDKSYLLNTMNNIKGFQRDLDPRVFWP
jgi:lipoprotein NlpI